MNRGFDLRKQEDTRPDVFLMNHASAYSGWYQVRMSVPTCVSLYAFMNECSIASLWQTMDNHAKWLDDLRKYLDNGKMLTNPPAVNGIFSVPLAP